MANTESTPLGLLTRGPRFTIGYDGEYVWDVDFNMLLLDALIRALQSQIESIVISGLPSTIDAGTF